MPKTIRVFSPAKFLAYLQIDQPELTEIPKDSWTHSCIHANGNGKRVNKKGICGIFHIDLSWCDEVEVSLNYYRRRQPGASIF